MNCYMSYARNCKKLFKQARQETPMVEQGPYVAPAVQDQRQVATSRTERWRRLVEWRTICKPLRACFVCIPSPTLCPIDHDHTQCCWQRRWLGAHPPDRIQWHSSYQARVDMPPHKVHLEEMSFLRLNGSGRICAASVGWLPGWVLRGCPARGILFQVGKVL